MKVDKCRVRRKQSGKGEKRIASLLHEEGLCTTKLSEECKCRQKNYQLMRYNATDGKIGVEEVCAQINGD